MSEPHLQEQPGKKKRKRNTVVCLPCRKRKIKCDRKKPCTQCAQSNASNFCFYSSPQWAVDTFLSNQRNNSISGDNIHLKPGNDISVGSTTTPAELNSRSVSIDGDMNRMRAYSNSLMDDNESRHFNSTKPDMDWVSNPFKQNGGPDFSIPIDFFKHFDTLEIKRSSDISSKPLSTSSLIRKDPHLRLVFQYYNARTIIRKLNKNCFPGSRPKTRGSESNIAHSVLDMIKINEDKIPQANSILDKKRKDAGILRMFGTSLSAPKDGKEDKEESESTKDAVKEEIFGVLREIPVVYMKQYMLNFWNFVYPTLPIFDRDEFEETLTRILGGVDIMKVDEKNPLHQDIRITRLDITQTFDLIHIAMFLVMLRFSYLAIITQLKMHEIDRILLKKLKIPSTFFNLGNKCLGFYKPFKKSKLILLQYFILVRNYSLFSVEDGEGNDISQGAVLNNICAVLLKMIGLNRDPLHNEDVYDFCFQEKSPMHMYTVRKLFWVAVTMDHKTTSLTGYLSNFSSNFINMYTDTVFPTALETDLPVEKYSHSLEVGICDYLKSSFKVSLMFSKIIDGTSRLHNHLSLQEIITDLNQMSAALKENNCELKNMKMFNIKNFTKDIEEVDYKDIDQGVLKLSLENFKIIELNFLALNLKVSTLHAILTFLEDKTVMADDLPNKQKILKMVTEMLIENLVALSDISHMYLNNEFRLYILKLDFHLNRLVQLAVEKTCLMLASLALKTSFAYLGTSKEVTQTSESVFYYCLLIMNEMGSLLFNSCGIKYYQGYKSLITLRFVFKLLSYYPFENTSSAMIQFFMNFYNLCQQRMADSDAETQKKIAMLYEKNSYQRGIKLPEQMSEFMSKWQPLNVENKSAFEHTRLGNCFNDFEIVKDMLEKLKNSKSVKNQIFKFSYRSAGKILKGKEAEQREEFTGFAETPNENCSKEDTSKQHIPNFTIVTEHCPRNILNEPNINDDFEMSNQGKLPEVMDFLKEPYGKKVHDVNTSQQMPSLLGDEKIVKYLVPGFEDKMQELKKTTSLENEDMKLMFEEMNGDNVLFNDAVFNYGLDVLLGENEMFPQDDVLFKE